MKLRIPLETMLRIIRITSSPMLGWPLSPDSSRIDVLKRRTLRILSAINLLFLLPAFVYNMYLHKEDHLNMFLNSTEIIATCAVLMFIIICKVEEKSLQRLIAETQSFSENATKEEMTTIQFYMDKYTLLHLAVVIVAFCGSSSFVVAPAVIAQPFPVKAAYPFSTEPLWIMTSLYVLHIVVTAQVASSICMTTLFATVTWTGVAKFHLLCGNIERAANQNDIRKCAREHQESLDFANRLSTTVGRMAVVVAASNFLAVTFAGLAITYRQFYSIDFAKLMLYMAVATVHLFLYAWPADHLAEMSQQVSESILHSQWVGKSHRMHSSMLLMELRAHDPLVIKVDGLLPALNLESFGSGLSTAFSYIATLLAIFDG